jgi:hypothetical protein
MRIRLKFAKSVSMIKEEANETEEEDSQSETEEESDPTEPTFSDTVNKEANSVPYEPA